MKNIFLLITCVIFINTYSQEHKKNLYLFINQKPSFQVKNDTLVMKQFEINFDTKCDKNIKLSVNKDGNLSKNITLKSTSNQIIKFKYENIKSNNNPLKINKKDLYNYLTTEEIICQIRFEEFVDILKSFNVFIINSEKNSDEYFLAQKVTIEKYIGL